MSDWNLADLLTATSGKLPGSLNPSTSIPIAGFSIDTRTIKPGEAFFAIKGESFDGHSFIPQAIKAGAGAIIASRFENSASSPACPLIEVSDPLVALQDAARWHRARHSGVFIGVTGSNGKTTTKEMLLHLFAGVTATWATSGNFNNHIGLPLNLVRIPLSTKVAIIEMGMNHSGEIRFLSGIAKPQTALITNVGPAHIGILGSLHNIALAKAEILEELSVGQHAILPGDDEFFTTLKGRTKADITTFGYGPGNSLAGIEVHPHPEGLDLKVRWHGTEAAFRLPLLGRHNGLNALAALTAFLSYGHPLQKGIELLSHFKPVNARLESHQIDGLRLILDCYNANPASMKEAVEFLAICKGRRVAVLGDMRELGDQGPALHHQLGEQVANAKLEHLVAVGDLAQEIAEGALQKGMAGNMVHPCRNNQEAANLLAELLLPGDTVLIKASRGMHFEEIIHDRWPSLKTDLH